MTKSQRDKILDEAAAAVRRLRNGYPGGGEGVNEVRNRVVDDAVQIIEKMK